MKFLKRSLITFCLILSWVALAQSESKESNKIYLNEIRISPKFSELQKEVQKHTYDVIFEVEKYELFFADKKNKNSSYVQSYEKLDIDLQDNQVEVSLKTKKVLRKKRLGLKSPIMDLRLALYELFFGAEYVKKNLEKLMDKSQQRIEAIQRLIEKQNKIDKQNENASKDKKSKSKEGDKKQEESKNNKAPEKSPKSAEDKSPEKIPSPSKNDKNDKKEKDENEEKEEIKENDNQIKSNSGSEKNEIKKKGDDKNLNNKEKSGNKKNKNNKESEQKSKISGNKSAKANPKNKQNTDGPQEEPSDETNTSKDQVRIRPITGEQVEAIVKKNDSNIIPSESISNVYVYAGFLNLKGENIEFVSTSTSLNFMNAGLRLMINLTKRGNDGFFNSLDYEGRVQIGKALASEKYQPPLAKSVDLYMGYPLSIQRISIGLALSFQNIMVGTIKPPIEGVDLVNINSFLLGPEIKYNTSFFSRKVQFYAGFQPALFTNNDIKEASYSLSKIYFDASIFGEKWGQGIKFENFSIDSKRNFGTGKINITTASLNIYYKF